MKRTSRLLLPVVVLAAAVAPAAARQGEQLELDPAVSTGTLANGLRYYVRANAQPEKRAELMLAVNAGSVLEADDQRGLAHFVEHMAFNGTASFEKQALVDWLESIGMQFGADVNAYTGFDETVFTLTVPTDTGTALQTGIQVLEEWAHRVTFDSTEIEKERGVVIEEWRLGQGAAARMRDRIFPVLLAGSRYADRLPIGSLESLQTFDPAALRRFYHDWYRPDLMAVIAVGDFDVAGVVAMIRERFERIPRPVNAPPRPEYAVPDHATPRVVIATDPEATGTSVEVYDKQPALAEGTVAAYRYSLAARLYNSMLNARLGEIARRAEPPFLSAGSGYGALLRTKAAYVVSADVRDGEVIGGLDAVLSEAERAARHGFTRTELDRQKSNIQRAYQVALAERDKTESVSYANEYLRNFLEGEASPGIEAEYALLGRLLPDIGLDEVEALSTTWMSDSNRVVVVQAPAKDSAITPTPERILATFDSVRSRDLAPYQDLVADAPLVPTPPAPGTIVAESRDERLGTVDWRLSNGVRVVLRPTDFKNDEVLVRGFSPGGLSLVSDEDYMSGQFATLLVASSGIGAMDATQLQKALAGKAVQVSPSLSDLTEGISGSVSPADLETLFQLIYLDFTAARRDTAAFASLMSRLHGFLQNQSASPAAAFRDTLSVTLAQHHPRARPITEAILDEVHQDRALSIYRDRFADASDFTFVVVGAFQPDSIRPLVLRWLGGLPATHRSETWRDLGIEPPAGVVEKVVRKGVEPQAQTALVFSGDLDTYDAATAHVLASVASVLEIRLREVLREDLGGTYDVSVGQSAGRFPRPRWAVTIAFGADPARIDSLTTVVFSEIAKLGAEGPDSVTFEKVRETQRRNHETEMRENGYWVGQIASALLRGDAPGTFLDYDTLIDELTPEAIAAGARRFLDPGRYVRVTLLPENAGDDSR